MAQTAATDRLPYTVRPVMKDSATKAILANTLIGNSPP